MKDQDLRAKLSAQLPYYSVSDNERKTNECVQITLDYAREEAISFYEWRSTTPIKNIDQYTNHEAYEIYLTTKTQNK